MALSQAEKDHIRAEKERIVSQLRIAWFTLKSLEGQLKALQDICPHTGAQWSHDADFGAEVHCSLCGKGKDLK